jgi:DtxR family Mn-dependent transcriptional regulator
MVSSTEENYLKAIFKISEKESAPASTNSIATEMKTSAASVSDMIKRLAEKELVIYEKWKGVTLQEQGKRIATGLIRRHRLWEVFLVDKLNFSWDEIHPIAEELEHIKSDELAMRLDEFLGFPKFDPHGDPIPDENGNFTFRKQILLSEFKGQKGNIVGVDEHSTQFLQYLDRLELTLGTPIELLERVEYDGSIRIRIKGETEQIISNKVAQNLYVKAS